MAPSFVVIVLVATVLRVGVEVSARALDDPQAPLQHQLGPKQSTVKELALVRVGVVNDSLKVPVCDCAPEWAHGTANGRPLLLTPRLLPCVISSVAGLGAPAPCPASSSTATRSVPTAPRAARVWGVRGSLSGGCPQVDELIGPGQYLACQDRRRRHRTLAQVVWAEQLTRRVERHGLVGIQPLEMVPAPEQHRDRCGGVGPGVGHEHGGGRNEVCVHNEQRLPSSGRLNGDFGVCHHVCAPKVGALQLDDSPR